MTWGIFLIKIFVVWCKQAIVGPTSFLTFQLYKPAGQTYYLVHLILSFEARAAQKYSHFSAFPWTVGLKILQAGCKGGGFALNNSTLVSHPHPAAGASRYLYAGEFCGFGSMAKIAKYQFVGPMLTQRLNPWFMESPEKSFFRSGWEECLVNMWT